MENQDDNKNKNIEYEIFVKEIYQSLLENDEINTVKVQHDVNLYGKSGCQHQIDVYWEFESAGVTTRIAVECKNYNTSNISIGKIRDFYAALVDIGNISGIFVCKNGYQSGAIKFASYYGINVVEIRTPKESDWEGRVRTIQIDTSLIHTNINSRFVNIDFQWFNEKYPNIIKEKINSISGNSNEIFIKDNKGNNIANMLELENELPCEFKEELNKEHEYLWDDAYIEVINFGLIKVKSVKFNYDIKIFDLDEIIIDGKEVAKAILKNVITGEIKFFNKDGNVK